MVRKIIHIDMDCFYAAVEIRDNPSLKGKPVAVGGRQRGVLTTASYEARKFGLRSAMPTATALRLCPDLILLPVNFEKYRKESRTIREIFKKYTNKIQPLSLDEAFLDVTESSTCGGIATQIASEIRKNIFHETQLTASAGIAPNKFLAKVASDWKKPNGQFTITPQMVGDFVKILEIKKIPGVGKVTTKKMHELGVQTCGDLQSWSLPRLQNTFGSWGIKLYDFCRGIDHREVSTDGEIKSISVENTYNNDLLTVEECKEKIPELFKDLERRIEKYQLKDHIKSLVVKLKFFDFKQTTVESSELKVPSIEAFEILLEKGFNRGTKAVRLIGIGAKLKSQQVPQETTQLKLI
jgi:DNA polymerase-4